MAEKLAIYNQLPEIVNLVENNQVTWVIVDTGCGKSVGIMWALLKKGKRIVCTQPTIPAAISLFEYQKKLSPNSRIGYAAEGDKHYDNRTQGIYATAGHIRKIMEKYFKNGKASDITFCSYLMIDEIHGGTKDNSIILDLWYEARRQEVRVPNIILSTATDFGTEALKERFGGVTFRSNFRHYDVKVRYNHKNYSIDDDNLYRDVAAVAVDLLFETLSHGIVFVSGAEEVEDTAFQIESLLNARAGVVKSKFKYPVQVVTCFSQDKRENIELAIRNEKEVEDPIVKIVVATNIAESSLTIVDAKFVVDTMLEKRADLINNRFHLGECYISKNSADQRKGRTGRTIEGSICHRMCTEERYQLFETHRPLEIRRTSIYDVVIEFLSIGLSPENTISELDKDKLKNAKTVLSELGCVIYNDNAKESTPIVTDIGHFVATIPMDVRNSAALYYFLNGLEEKNFSKIEPHYLDENLFWVLATLTIIDLYGPSLFWWPRKMKDEKPKDYQIRMREYAQDHFSDFEGDTPIISLLNAFKACLDNGEGLDTPFYKMKKWCGKNSCNNKKMREIIIQLKRMMRILNFINPDTYCQYEEVSDEKAIECIPKLIKCLHRTYHDISLKNHRYVILSKDDRAVKLDTMKTVSTSTGNDAPIYLPLSEIQIKDSKGRISLIISLWIPIYEEIKEPIQAAIAIPIEDPDLKFLK